MYAIYNLLTAAGMILLLPYFFVRGLLNGKYMGQVRERLGWRFPPELRAGGPNPARPDPARDGTIWIHAVSVGEVLAALPLGGQIKQRYPGRRVVLSTTTKTGQRLARERARFADAVFYFPLDWKGPVRRSLAAVAPTIVLIVETEIWPNFLRECRRAAVPVVFVNGRLSERSFRGFRRALIFSLGALRGFLTRILNDATLFLMQSERDAARLLALGANRDRVVVTGNLKYDLGDPAGTPVSNWLEQAVGQNNRGPVVVAGSLLAGEEEIILQAFALIERSYPRSLLIVAPRKPERFEAAARIIRDSRRGLVRRSALSLNGGGGAALAVRDTVLLLDSVGELASVYGVADVVFVGGSLVPAGGHNILEPAAYGKAPVYGPSMENFQDMARQYLEAGAAVEVKSWEQLADAWSDLLAAPDRAARMGTSARRLVEQNRGATGRVLAQIEKVLDRERGRA